MAALVEMTGLTRDYGWFRPKRALDSLQSAHAGVAAKP